MKTSELNEHNEPLRQVLREWSVAMPLPPRFRERVWQRIERAETQTPHSFWSFVRQWIEHAMSRPSLAFSCVAFLLLFGLTTGYWQARGNASQAEIDLRLRYVQTVDPYRMPRN